MTGWGWGAKLHMTATYHLYLKLNHIPGIWCLFTLYREKLVKYAASILANQGS